MSDFPSELKSVAGVCELTVFEPKTSPRAWLLIEVPHGATRKSDYDAVASRMKSQLPAQLEHFFFVNTDIGAPEGGEFLGKTLSAKGIGVVLARCLIPRTFIDTNRVIARTKQGEVTDGLTAAIPSYVTDAADLAFLNEKHAAYHQLVHRAYAWVCGEKDGMALQLHSYAPKSVDIKKTDAGIVEALHAAYVPEVYAKWPERPAVDLIAATQDGSFRCSPTLVGALRASFAEAGIKAEENATYHLHPVTMGLHYAQQYPDKVLCVELNRGLVADPFTPFGVSPISADKVAKMTTPIAKVFETALG